MGSSSGPELCPRCGRRRPATGAPCPRCDDSSAGRAVPRHSLITSPEPGSLPRDMLLPSAPTPAQPARSPTAPVADDHAAATDTPGPSRGLSRVLVIGIGVQLLVLIGLGALLVLSEPRAPSEDAPDDTADATASGTSPEPTATQDLGPASLARARELLDRRRPREAAAMLDRLLAREPDDALLHYYRGRAHLAEDEPPQAATAFARARDRTGVPGTLHLFETLARARTGEYPAARDALARFSRTGASGETLPPGRVCHPAGGCRFHLTSWGEAVVPLDGLLIAEREGHPSPVADRFLSALSRCVERFARSLEPDPTVRALEEEVGQLLGARDDIAARGVERIFALADAYIAAERTEDARDALLAGLRVDPLDAERHLRLVELDAAADREAEAVSRARFMVRFGYWKAEAKESVAAAERLLMGLPIDAISAERVSAAKRSSLEGGVLLLLLFQGEQATLVERATPRIESAFGVTVRVLEARPLADTRADPRGHGPIDAVALRQQLLREAADALRGEAVVGVLGVSDRALRPVAYRARFDVSAGRGVGVATLDRLPSLSKHAWSRARREALRRLLEAAGSVLGLPRCARPTCARSGRAEREGEPRVSLVICDDCSAAFEQR